MMGVACFFHSSLSLCPSFQMSELSITLQQKMFSCRARDKTTGTICALKQIKMQAEKDGFPLSSIREINILLSLQHKNIVDVSEVVVGNRLDDIFMVMEYMEHDLKALMNTIKSMDKRFTIAEVSIFFSVELANEMCRLQCHKICNTQK